MVGRSLQGDICPHEPTQGISQIRACRIENGEVVQTRSAMSGRMATGTFPRVQPNVMMVAAGREKGRLISKSLHEEKPRNIPIKTDGAIEIGDLEVDVADAGSRGNGVGGLLVHEESNASEGPTIK